MDKTAEAAAGQTVSARQIEVFRMVMRLGSARRAAEALHISQPAVTQIVLQLEKSARLRLFDRSKGRMVPTAEAAALMDEVERVYVGLDAVQRKIDLLRSHEDTVLRVGALHAMAASVMPLAVANFTHSYPRSHCRLEVDSSRGLRERLLQRELDLAFMGDEVDTSGLTASEFYAVPAVCIVPATHPFAARGRIGVADLADAPLIGLDAADPAQRQLQSAFAGHGHTPRFVATTPYSHTQCALVLAGVGLAITNPLVARTYTALGLRSVPFGGAVHFRAILAFHPGQGQSTAAQQFVRLCRQRVEDLLR
ncbi:LysR family transcriptional regulator [Cupriavidus pauculus]|uniref:LysR family transcriptional regulator n=1 Tax=Cupriavidus pauculus TaxID=82633 RepID=A0A2N5CA69_9BURK|nr:LysR family transcriptional regulator [Cupriavidus pauculus]PLP99128.1 LysR family transcriptional regulator [Cupriavidus pauculus]